jgi:hypothetical protein
MRPERDFCQRRVYGIVRVSLAIIRLSRAEAPAQRQKAGEWLAAWMKFGGLRQTKADKILNKKSG